MKKIKLFFFALIVLVFSCCDTNVERDEYTDLVEGYIVGSFVCYTTDSKTGQANEFPERGFCIFLENSKNAETQTQMDFYTFNLPDGLFVLPEEIISENHNYNNCGPCFSPEDHTKNYKIKFRYRVVTKKEKITFACGPCSNMEQMFPWDECSEIHLKEIKNIKY